MTMRNVLAVVALSISIGPAVSAVEFSDWCAPVNLGPGINLSPASDGGPAISKNGLSLYFHSNRSGNFDLYVSQRESKDSPWGEPHNLGPTINTASARTAKAVPRFSSLVATVRTRRVGVAVWTSMLARSKPMARSVRHSSSKSSAPRPMRCARPFASTDWKCSSPETRVPRS